MLAVNFENGVVGLTWFPENFKGKFDGRNEEITWRVFGDSLENINVETAPETHFIRKVAPGEWLIRDAHGAAADLVQVENLSKVVVERIPLEERETLTVVKNPDLPPGNNPARDGEKVGEITEKDLPFTVYSSPLQRPMVQAGIGVAGVAIATGIVGRWLDWW